MISVKSLIESFSALLASCWDDLLALFANDTSGSLKADWLQANWEILVEGLLGDEGVVLEPYGDGADCNGESSRVLYPNRLPTHRLICTASNGDAACDLLNERPLNTQNDDIVFDRLVSLGKDGWYYEVPPFDKVLCEYNGESVVLDLEKIDIELQHIAESRT